MIWLSIQSIRRSRGLNSTYQLQNHDVDHQDPTDCDERTAEIIPKQDPDSWGTDEDATKNLNIGSGTQHSARLSPKNLASTRGALQTQHWWQHCRLSPHCGAEGSYSARRTTLKTAIPNSTYLPCEKNVTVVNRASKSLRKGFSKPWAVRGLIQIAKGVHNRATHYGT